MDKEKLLKYLDNEIDNYSKFSGECNDSHSRKNELESLVALIEDGEFDLPPLMSIDEDGNVRIGLNWRLLS